MPSLLYRWNYSVAVVAALRGSSCCFVALRGYPPLAVTLDSGLATFYFVNCEVVTPAPPSLTMPARWVYYSHETFLNEGVCRMTSGADILLR